ncbi:unnamed protein product [Medioppia subpectinata]|uniref:MD-2-related lipid-recognition domain-containing protein n=1 Tax=Medioppia subpectinata TaxID=1979941 RepID=A0A7R9Q018_9ACAR|nr:unnamed protein product [Medioppia subpectinata]CAG2106749.1 unnamed protein product [Medioppia subpectinata]
MLRIVCLLVLAVCVSAISFKDCGHAEVTKLDVSGCTGSGPCVLHKNTNISVTINFKANQKTSHAKWYLHAKIGGVDTDLTALLPGVDLDACHSTSCPINSGDTKQVVFKFTIPKEAPVVSDVDVTTKLIGDAGDLLCTVTHGDVKE